MHEQEEPYNLVPLTDMVFNLLIFFMAATTFAQVEKELGIELPQASALTPLSAPPKQLIINIEQDGQIIVAGRNPRAAGPGPVGFGPRGQGPRRRGHHPHRRTHRACGTSPM